MFSIASCVLIKKFHMQSESFVTSPLIRFHIYRVPHLDISFGNKGNSTSIMDQYIYCGLVPPYVHKDLDHTYELFVIRYISFNILITYLEWNFFVPTKYLMHTSIWLSYMSSFIYSSGIFWTPLCWRSLTRKVLVGIYMRCMLKYWKRHRANTFEQVTELVPMYILWRAAV